MSEEMADRFVEALWKLEEDRDVSGYEGLREFWTSYRDEGNKVEHFIAYFDSRTLTDKVVD